MNLCLVEFAEYLLREAFDSEPQHPEPRLPHGGQTLDRHRIDPVGADELQVRRQTPCLLGCDDSLAQRQHPLVSGEGKDVVLKNHRARARMGGHDSLDHGQALLRVQACDRSDTALRLVQEVRGRAKRATHRAVIESDQPHRADLGQMSFPRRLAG